MRTCDTWRRLTLAPLVTALACSSVTPGGGEAERSARSSAAPPRLDPGGETETSLTRGGTTITLPARASDAVTLRTAHMGLSFRLESSAPTPARAEGRGLAYDDALGPGTTLLLTPTRDGVEDHVRFETRPERPFVRYSVDVSEAAGLRLVGNVLELLDPGGAPRLRVAPPFVLDARGVRHPARLALVDCAYDDDPAPPWGRSPVGPGRDVCSLEVGWRHAGITYPATLDPVWEPTASLATPRVHTQLALVGAGPHLGKVVAVGGLSHDTLGGGSPDGQALDAVEAFDPSTDTWATLAPLPTPRRSHSSSFVELASGPTVLVAGGCALYQTPACRSTDVILLDLAGGTWAPGPSLPEERGGHWYATLASGRVLLGGGVGATLTQPVAAFDPATGAWQAAAPATIPRAGPATVPLPDGRLLVVGGLTLDANLQQFDTDSAELYDPTLDAWLPAGTMSLPRRAHRAVRLAGGDVLVAGGLNLVSELSLVERWSSATQTFTTVGELEVKRNQHAMAPLPNGGAIVFAGAGGEARAHEVFDAQSDTWTAIEPSLDDPWRHAQSVTLLDGRALFVGGIFESEFPAAHGQVVVVATYAQGAPCATNAECATGACVEGVCCDTPCDGGCFSCTAAGKGHGVDGTCEVVSAGLADPKQSCAASGSAACGADGTCDGAGACTVPAAGAPCAACPPNHVGACDGQGTCVCEGPTCLDEHTLRGADGATLDCAPYVCEADDCAHSCNTGSDCAAGYTCSASYECIPFGDGQAGGSPAPAVASGGCALASAPFAGGAWPIAMWLVALAHLARARRAPPSAPRVAPRGH